MMAQAKAKSDKMTQMLPSNKAPKQHIVEAMRKIRRNNTTLDGRKRTGPLRTKDESTLSFGLGSRTSTSTAAGLITKVRREAKERSFLRGAHSRLSTPQHILEGRRLEPRKPKVISNPSISSHTVSVPSRQMSSQSAPREPKLISNFKDFSSSSPRHASIKNHTATNPVFATSPGKLSSSRTTIPAQSLVGNVHRSPSNKIISGGINDHGDRSRQIRSLPRRLSPIHTKARVAASPENDDIFGPASASSAGDDSASSVSSTDLKKRKHIAAASDSEGHSDGSEKIPVRKMQRTSPPAVNRTIKKKAAYDPLMRNRRDLDRRKKALSK
jgi:hypothetical protein